MMLNCEQTIIAWIKENCLKGKSELELTSRTSLLATSILDSLQFMALVEYLSAQYSVKIDEDDMSPDNFESVEAIARLIAGLKSA
jgi:acyl carrier protein